MDWNISDLEKWNKKIESIAKSYNLDWFPIDYEVCDYYEMIGHMSYHGMPTYYSHWSYGKSFERTHQMYNLGMTGLPYELIINSDPSIAYLMRENPLYLQVLIMAHCVGHSDFFKNNSEFKDTNPSQIIFKLNSAKKRIQEYIEDPTIGIDRVEKIIDACHAIQYQIDRNNLPRISNNKKRAPLIRLIKDTNDLTLLSDIDIYKNPIDPDFDILSFMLENGSHLEPWVQDIVEIVKDTSYYFMPQIKTKILNEGWACVTGDTLIDTNRGLMLAKDLVSQNYNGKLFDGEDDQEVVNWFYNQDKKRIKIKTDEGFELHGGFDHKIKNSEDEWVKLCDLSVGDTIEWTPGNNQWGKDYQVIGANHKFRQTKEKILKEKNVSSYLYRKYKSNSSHKVRKQHIPKIENVNITILENNDLFFKPDGITFPILLTEDLATILGLLVSDGCFSNHCGRIKGGVTTGDFEIVELLNKCFKSQFNTLPSVSKDENRWRVMIPNDAIVDWFVKVFQFDYGKSNFKKFIPKQIFASPKAVVTSFMRSLYDGDGYAGNGTTVYSTTSDLLSKQVVSVLTKMGIFSTRRLIKASKSNHYDGYTIITSGKQTELFRDLVGFNLSRKMNRISNYKSKFERKNKKLLTVTNISHDTGDTFDFSVTNSHTYMANGFKNHNCFWHYKIMNELDLPDSMHIPFLKSHNQVVCPHQGSVNPYHLGFYIFNKIYDEHGLDECFFVRENMNDISAIRQFIHHEDLEKLGLFTYSQKDNIISVDEVSTNDDWKTVKDNLIMTSGVNNIPVIYVDELLDNNILILKHAYDGRSLDLEYAEMVKNHIIDIWGNDVKIYTIIEDDEWEI